MSPFLQRLLKDHMLQAYIISAKRVVANDKLIDMFRWDGSEHPTYWHSCYGELHEGCQLTEEDVEYIRTNYPEFFI